MPASQVGSLGGSTSNLLFAPLEGADRSMQGRSSGKVVGQRGSVLALRGTCPSEIGSSLVRSLENMYYKNVKVDESQVVIFLPSICVYDSSTPPPPHQHSQLRLHAENAFRKLVSD